MDVARGFFQNMEMPPGFHRAKAPVTISGITPDMVAILKAHPIEPGSNQGRVNSYTPDPTSANFTDVCLLYTNFVKNIVVGNLYPNPKGILRNALKNALDSLFSPFEQFNCSQIFPYGR